MSAVACPTRRLADHLHQGRPFDMIHADFIYLDAVIGASLGGGGMESAC